MISRGEQTDKRQQTIRLRRGVAFAVTQTKPLNICSFDAGTDKNEDSRKEVLSKAVDLDKKDWDYQKVVSTGNLLLKSHQCQKKSLKQHNTEPIQQSKVRTTKCSRTTSSSDNLHNCGLIGSINVVFKPANLKPPYYYLSIHIFFVKKCAMLLARFTLQRIEFRINPCPWNVGQGCLPCLEFFAYLGTQSNRRCYILNNVLLRECGIASLRCRREVLVGH